MLSVLVTSAGTASAISVIKSLKRLNGITLRIFAVDADPLAAGLHLADKYFIVSKANSPGYVQELIDICVQNNITILFSIYSKEIEVISKNRSLFDSKGIKFLLAPSESVALCNDKVAMHDLAKSLNIKTPSLFKFSELSSTSRFPLFVKPRSSSSSSNAFKVSDLEELKFFTHKYPDLIIQEFIDAPEITVDVFCNQQSEVIVASARKRLATKSGQAVKGETISNSPYKEIIQLVCKKLKMVGVCNFQFFDHENGPIFIELNPRFAAGGLMLTVEAGANLPGLYIKELQGLPVNASEIDVQEGVIMTRFWDEIFLKKNY